jgi:hypothetical protein
MNLRSLARVSAFPLPYSSACQPAAVSSLLRMRRVRSGYVHRLGFALAAQASAAGLRRLRGGFVRQHEP